MLPNTAIDFSLLNTTNKDVIKNSTSVKLQSKMSRITTKKTSSMFTESNKTSADDLTSSTITIQEQMNMFSFSEEKNKTYEEDPIKSMGKQDSKKKQNKKHHHSSKNKSYFTKIRKNIKFNDREKILLRESWAIMIIDGLNAESLKKFYHDVNNDQNIILMDNNNNVLSNNVYMKANDRIDNDQFNNIDISKLYLTINGKMIMDSIFCTQVYENLIALDSQLDISFPTLRHQTVGTSKIINKLIQNLEDTSVLDDDLKSLGKRHSRIIGINVEQFSALGIALLKTFDDRFGILFSNELSDLWLRLYTYLANSLLIFGEDPQLVQDGSIGKMFIKFKQESSEQMSDNGDDIPSTTSTTELDTEDTDAYDSDLTEFSIPIIEDNESRNSIPSIISQKSHSSRRSSSIFPSIPIGKHNTHQEISVRSNNSRQHSNEDNNLSEYNSLPKTVVTDIEKGNEVFFIDQSAYGPTNSSFSKRSTSNDIKIPIKGATTYKTNHINNQRSKFNSKLHSTPISSKKKSDVPNKNCIIM